MKRLIQVLLMISIIVSLTYVTVKTAFSDSVNDIKVKADKQYDPYKH